MALSEDHVREELKKVIDPELFVNIVDLGLIYVVDIQPGEEGKENVHVEMIEGVGAVDIKVVMDPPWTQDRMTEDARDQLGIF